MNKPTPQTIATLLGCTTEQASAQLRRNAQSMRDYTNQELMAWGRTREEANAIADEYEQRSKLVEVATEIAEQLGEAIQD